MANITPMREARFAESNTQKGGKGMSARTPMKKGPAVGRTGSPNGGAKGGIARTPKGPITGV